MLRKVLPLCMAFSLVAAVAFAAEGQGQPGPRGEGGRGGRGEGAPGFGMGQRGGGFMMGKMSLLSNEQVQKELKLTEEQTKKLTSIREEQQKKMGELRGPQNMRDLSQEERRQAMAELQKKRTALTEETEKAAMAVLKEDQVKRLDQIAFQQQGLRGLTQEATAKKFGLEESQITKITEILRQSQDERMKLFREMRPEGGGRPDEAAFAKMQEKTKELNKQAETKVLEVLNDSQKKMYAEMKGQPFELQMPARGAFGGFGQGRGGPGGQGEGAAGAEGGRQGRGRRGGGQGGAGGGGQ